MLNYLQSGGAGMARNKWNQRKDQFIVLRMNTSLTFVELLATNKTGSPGSRLSIPRGKGRWKTISQMFWQIPALCLAHTHLLNEIVE